MPDTGDFPHRNEPVDATRGWSDAFAALPQEAPEAGGWQRLQGRLPMSMPVPATRARLRTPLWLATAASLLLAVAIPMRLLPQAESVTSAPLAQATGAPAAAQPIVPPPLAIEFPAVSMPVSKRDAPPRGNGAVPSRRPIRTVAPPVEATRVAAAREPPATDLEPLYAQSAQLESLLAMARDERVASGTSAALSEELDARVAGIDTALIQPGLDDAHRAELWGRRVDALQQLVGIETTQRLYAARGQSYQAALVSVD